jgi:hypothetical protein
MCPYGSGKEMIRVAHLAFGSLSIRSARSWHFCAFMDNCLSHFQQVILSLFGETHGPVITSASHKIPIFQTLNRKLFKISDRQARYKLPFDKILGTIGLVLKVCDHVARMIALKTKVNCALNNCQISILKPLFLQPQHLNGFERERES